MNLNIHFKHFLFFFFSLSHNSIQIPFCYRISYENFTSFCLFFSCFAVRATIDGKSLIPGKLIKWIVHTITYYFPVMSTSLGCPMLSYWLIYEARVLSDLGFEYSTTSKFLTRLFKDRCDWIIRPLKNYNIRFVLCGEKIPIIHKKKKGKNITNSLRAASWAKDDTYWRAQIDLGSWLK